MITDESDYLVAEYIEGDTMPLEGDGNDTVSRKYRVYIDHKQSLVTDSNYDLIYVIVNTHNFN